MRIVIAPQAFKGTLSASEAAQAMKEGLLRVAPHHEVSLVPVADGGDGTYEVLQGHVKDEKVIEIAKICGFALERNPAITSTYQLGELILQLLDQGHRRFIIGLGGSCTNDGGAGMAQALGACFLDIEEKELPKGGLALSQLHRIDLTHLDPRLKKADFIVACDVLNPLLGPSGCSLVYAQQKGADENMVLALEKSLNHYAEILNRDVKKNCEKIPGSGAAGGTGGGLAAFCNAKLESGIDLILRKLDFDRILPQVDLVVTGEGCMDGQTQYYKAPLGVARAAKSYQLPVIAIVGRLGRGFETLYQAGIDAIIPTSFLPIKDLPSNPYEILVQTSEQVFRLLFTGGKLKNV